MAQDDIRIVISGDSADAVNDLKKVSDSLGQLGDKATAEGGKASRVMENLFGEKGIAGVGRRDFKESLMGFSLGLESIGSAAGAVDAGLGKAAQSTARFISEAMYLSPVAAALALVGAAVAALVAKDPALAAFDEKIKKLAEVEPAVQGLMDLAGVTELQAQAALEAAQQNQDYARALADLASQTEVIPPIIVTFNEALSGLKTFLGDVGETAAQAASLIAGFGGAIAGLQNALQGGKSIQEAFADAQTAFGQTTVFVHDKLTGLTPTVTKNADAQTKLNALVKDAPKYTKEYASAIGDLAKAQNDLLKGMLEKTLTPTSVTDADMQATKAGTYTNKWDEFARRADALAKGTSATAFGAVFSDQFAKLGLSAEQAAAKFRDFSLFADPKNLKLVDWDAVTTDIGNQLQALVGKANLMKEGMAKAWASLSASQRSTLREMGIESASDAAREMLGVGNTSTASLVKSLSSKDNTKAVNAAGSQIIAAVSGGMLDKDAQKTWTSTADTMVQTMIAQFTSKNNVSGLRTAGVTLLETIAQGVGESSALSDALVKAVNQALADGVAAAGGTSNNVTVNYIDNSALSLSDKKTAARLIAPIVMEANKSINGRQANVP